MSRGVDLTSKEWRDLVFDGKNKQFGAYESRRRSKKLHLWVTLISVAVIAAIFFIIKWRMDEYAAEQERLRAERERMSEVQAETPQDEPEDIPEEEETIEPEYIEPEEIPVVEEVASQQMTEIAIVEVPDKDKEVKTMDEVKENEAQIGNINQEGTTDITKVQEATVAIVAPPAPKVEPKPEPKKPEPEKIFEAVEQQAQFPGGAGALNSWLSKNLRYPELAQQNNIEGRVIVQFVVEKDGSISHPVIARGVDKELDKEAIRVVKRMPKWQPGKNNGVAVRSKFTLPVVFKLQH